MRFGTILKNICFLVLLLITSVFILSYAGSTGSKAELLARNYGDPPGETKPYKLLKEMTQFISRHDNATFKAEVMYDRVNDDGIKIQRTGSEKVFIQKPDKLFVEFKTDFFSDWLLYNQNTATLLDTTTNQYTSINEMPGSINTALDFLENSFGFVMPLSNLIYIYPYKKIVKNIQSAEYIGTSNVFGVRCHHLLFKEYDKYWQIWIEDGKRKIPRKVVVTYKTERQAPQFIAIINDWIFNEPFPPKMFDQNLKKNARPSPENLFRERSESKISIFD